MILDFLLAYGISYVIVNESIFEAIKDKILSFSTIHPYIYKFFDKVLNCQPCCGFWVTIFIQLFFYIQGLSNPLSIPIVSICSYSFIIILNKLLDNK